MNNKILITGASNGLGYNLAHYFFKKGYPLLIHGRNKEKLIKLESELKHNEKTVETFLCELDNEMQIHKLSSYALEKGVKILINNAGMSCPGKKLEELSSYEINMMINTNLKAPILLTKYLQKKLTDIININSMIGLEPRKSRTIYSASKFGLRGFSESLKLENSNINILDVYPTNIKTWKGRKNAMDVEEVIQKIYESFLLKEKILIIDGRNEN
tara:strand:+ start:183 stop:827 length:645 start_codon:yes stop_codon:yes gene_type:complete